ncbi:unnamed protein product, partial [Ectocarpus fasciculatus]
VGIASDGVLIYSGLSSEGEDVLSTTADRTDIERLDKCGGTLSPSDDRLYHYRAMPNVHDLLDAFEPYRGPRLLGLGMDGNPIYSPYNDRGLLQAGLDNCNGKVLNGSYAYYSTPWFPYTVGCF